jgi:glycerophosphoryl diester phosphodiesterase
MGHRGALSIAPENTLASFAAAREAQANGVEFDVQLSRDGALVIIHDETVDRTTDGHGAIADLTLAEIQRLDAGSRFDARFAGERIPTLQQVFDLLGTRMLLNIEIKSKSADGGALEEQVVANVRERALESRVIISSFNPATLRTVRRIAPDLRLGYLYEREADAALIAELQPEALHPRWTLATPALVAEAHAQGRQVNVWTVNEEADLRAMIALSVDAIITNWPQRLAGLHSPSSPALLPSREKGRG